MPNVLVLGCGRGQIPVMNLCHKYGWRVIGVSPKGNYPGFDKADSVIFADVRNYKDVLIHIKDIKVDAVITDQLDVGVLTAAQVAEYYNLKGIGTNVATLFTNKYEMRKRAEQIGINVPNSICVRNSDEAIATIENEKRLKFPLMMKPADSDASRGVHKIYNKEELKDLFLNSLSYSKCKNVIIEEFIAGREFVIEAYTSNGNTTNLIVGHRDYFNIPDTFIPCATVFVDANSADSDLENRLKRINKKIVEGFGLPFGITHAEFLYNEAEDKIYLVEIAARGGGVFISSDLIPAACGVDANDLLVREVLGMNLPSEIALTKGAAAYFCYLLPEGVVKTIDGTNDVSLKQGVRKAFFDNIFIGMTTQSIRDKSSRKGPILVEGTTKEDCYRTIKKIKYDLQIKIENNGEIRNAIWE